MFWPNFTFHKMKKRELIIPIAALAIILGVFYRQYRAQQRLVDLEKMLNADAVVVEFREQREALEDPQGFMQRYMLPADVTETLRKVKFTDGATFKLLFLGADDEILGRFEFFPVKGEFEEPFSMVWRDTSYVAKWGGYYYSFAVKDYDVMAELAPCLEQLGVGEQ